MQKDETDETAVVREVREETGLEVVVDDELGSVDIPAGHDVVYAVRDFRCTVVGGALMRGDDAANVDWFMPRRLLNLRRLPDSSTTYAIGEC